VTQQPFLIKQASYKRRAIGKVKAVSLLKIEDKKQIRDKK
jgi:hypothetical protein